ncbi:MAG: ABC transporter transmembrane domain-containing protein [Gammaproteobacteria bacterium]
MAPVLVGLVWFSNDESDNLFRVKQVLAEATGYLQEVLSGIKTVQLYRAERLVVDEFKRRNWLFYKAQNVSNVYDALLFSLIEGITTLALALLLWHGAGELVAGAITLGVLVAFMEYIQRLFVPIREFAQQLAVLQRALAALDRIQQLCQAPLDPAEISTPANTAPRSVISTRWYLTRFRFDIGKKARWCWITSALSCTKGRCWPWLDPAARARPL